MTTTRQRLIISTNSAAGDPVGATASERDAITGFLKGRGWEFWHWFEDLWLVVVPAGLPQVAPDVLRDDLRGLLPSRGRHLLIINVDDGVHAGFGPAVVWPWMRNIWAEPSPQADATPAAHS